MRADSVSSSETVITAWDVHKRKISAIQSCSSGPTKEDAIGNDATGESTITLETQPPQIPVAATPMKLSDEDSKSSPQGDQGQSRRTCRRLD